MTTMKRSCTAIQQLFSGNATRVEQKDGTTLTVKYGKGDKVYIRLNKMNNPTNQMRRHSNTIMYVIAPMDDEWYFVGETPDNSTGYGMPVHIDEMEMRYQHVNNWSDEQWYMYNNTTTSYSETTKEDEKPMTKFKNGDKITITFPLGHADFAKFDGREGVVEDILDGLSKVYQIALEGGRATYWAYEHELKKREETPVKEKLTVNAPLAKRGYSANFLAQMSILVSDLGGAVDSFNDAEDVVSQIESLELVINTGVKGNMPFKVHLATHNSGNTGVVFEEMS